jgi:hypothetical protein
MLRVQGAQRDQCPGSPNPQDHEVADTAAFEPSEKEMDEFRQRMNISQSGEHSTTTARRLLYSRRTLGNTAASPLTCGPAGGSRPCSRQALRLPSASSRPVSALSRPCSAVSCRPASAAGRAAASGRPVKDALMHARPVSARTGGTARVMTVDEYQQTVGAALHAALQAL